MAESATDFVLIEDDDNLLRRIPSADPSFIKEDGTITSFAFKPRKHEIGLSVDIEKLTTHEKAISDRKKFRLAKLKASVPKGKGLEVIHDPVEGNFAHALIKGEFSSSICRYLARNSQFA